MSNPAKPLRYTWRTQTCVLCSAVFHPRYGKRNHRFCSAECYDQHRANRKRERLQAALENLAARRTLSHRLWSRVVTIANGCMEWRDAATDGHGYGVLRINKKNVRAHRLAWVLTHGQEIPCGMMVLHSCDNPSCVNPEHLRLGNQFDNMADMTSRGRHWKQVRTRRNLAAINGQEVR